MEFPVTLKIGTEVDSKANNPFKVVITVEIKDPAFRERMENINRNFYFEERPLLSTFLRGKMFKFMFLDIVSISGLPDASPKRMFSQFQLFEGLCEYQFENERNATLFASEAKVFLNNNYKKEYEHYLGLKEIDTIN